MENIKNCIQTWFYTDCKQGKGISLSMLVGECPKPLVQIFLKFVKRFQRGKNHKNRTKKRGKTTSNCFPILLYFLVFF